MSGKEVFQSRNSEVKGKYKGSLKWERKKAGQEREVSSAAQPRSDTGFSEEYEKPQFKPHPLNL